MNKAALEQRQVMDYFNETTSFYDRSQLDDEDEFLRFFSFEEDVIPKYVGDVGSCVDIGSGAGVFLKYVSRRYGAHNVIGLDVSEGMLAQSLLDKPFQADLAQGSVLDLPLREGRFDLVFMEEVLHHLVSRSRADSKKLAKRAIGNIKRMVRPGGAFILREEYYESWLIPTISSTLIMLLLGLFNVLRIKLPHKEAHMGLKVAFYTRDEIRAMVEEAGGEILEARDVKWTKTLGERAALVKTMGKMYYIITFDR
ncbi:MAG TPA: class I SAM-dependent methyltransferase [Candidatus Bathyarchaeia archaeon]